jgi:light-regulated signal transduction histidine kinase (bacteriophytochrome)
MNDRLRRHGGSFSKKLLRIEARTADLALANRELEAFSYTVSHDLQAPLRQMLIFVELLDKSCSASLDEQGRGYLQDISQAGRRMRELIGELLSLSRISRVELSESPIDFNRLVEEARQALLAETKTRSIEWRIHPLPLIHGDGALMRSVMVNLLSNALKYTRPRPVAQIEIGANSEGEEVVFFVRDNGVGFDAELKERLFGVFQRLHPSTKFEGMGVGLASVRRIIARHGGKTWAEGHVECGATIAFTLPRERLIAESFAPATYNSRGGANEPASSAALWGGGTH